VHYKLEHLVVKADQFKQVYLLVCIVKAGWWRLVVINRGSAVAVTRNSGSLSVEPHVIEGGQTG